MITRLAGQHVLVTGWGISGRAVAASLQDLRAHITVTDARPASRDEVTALGHEFAAEAELGALERFALVITSPGFRPESPVLVAAAGAGIPVWGDIEFTWRIDQAQRYGPTRRWLVVTGTNGKTTTTSMLASVLSAAGLDAIACGNIGLPVLDALRRPAVEVLAVELSSFQLYWAPSVRPAAGVVLNIAEDHLDWHGGMAGYVAAKQRALGGDVAVVGLDDPIAAALPHTAGFRLGPPGPGELGVVDGMLVDRAFGGRADTAESLGPVAGISPPGPAGVLDALAAASLARAIGVKPEAVAAGLAAHRVGPHRAETVHEIGGVGFIDDSKATNPHAARSSLLAHASVVWLAGGQLKGAAVDDLVVEVSPRLRGAVLIGVDAYVIAQALARHAPDVPVVTVRPRDDAGVTTEAGVTPVTSETPDSVMARAVRTAAGMARPGDVVLLAPAAASLDMFTSYGHRGDVFSAAARGLTAADIQGERSDGGTIQGGSGAGTPL